MISIRKPFKSAVGFAATTVLFAALLLFPCLPAADTAAPLKGRLIILTSFPDALFEPYRRAFQAKNPELAIHVLNRKTSAAISYIQGKSSRQVDLVWASAPDAFEVLKHTGHLRKVDLAGNGPVRYVAGYPLDDPDGYYTGFAVSGYGIMWNTAYLRENRLPRPKNWEDLTDPVFSGHLAITAPSRSGTTHLIAEIILQSKGWRDGWALLLKMSGNLATVTARSFGVRDGIWAGRFGVGPVIDFFGLSSMLTGKPVAFAYPLDTVLLPANIAVVKGAENVPAATAFIRFLKSAAGQRILFRPGISRLPIRADVYRDAPDGYPNPFNKSIKTRGLRFDSDLSRQRYHLVNSLYDNLITYRLPAVKAAWNALHRAEAALAEAPDPAFTKQIRAARDLLTQVPVTDEQSQQASFTSNFSRRKPGFAVSERQTALEEAWIAGAKARYAKARRIADDVLSVLSLRGRAARSQ